MPDTLSRNGAWTTSPCRESLLKAASELDHRLLRHQEERPDTLFHYTNTAGLIGMLSSNRLWATHAGFVNDSRELLHAAAIVESALDEKIQEASDEIVKEMCIRSKRMLRPFGGLRDTFIVCFCEASDLLSQWRAYGKSGDGFAMGFATLDLISKDPDKRVFLLRKVIYDVAVQKALASSAISAASDSLLAHAKGMSSETASSTIAYHCAFLDDYVAEYLFTFKDPAFSEEREWRAVCVLLTPLPQRLPVRFREGPGYPIPYLALDLTANAGIDTGRLPIGNIVVGPRVNMELALASLDWIKRGFGYRFAEVNSSLVPLRG
jgi:hypothetical protein